MQLCTNYMKSTKTSTTKDNQLFNIIIQILSVFKAPEVNIMLS